MLGDWRLGDDAQIVDDFGNRMEMSMAGRIGNTVTINGQLPTPLQARSGERVRLRLFNAANARRSEEHTSELQSLMRTSYAVFCLKKKQKQQRVQLTTPT